MKKELLLLFLTLATGCQSPKISSEKGPHETLSSSTPKRSHATYATHRYYQPVYPVKVDTYENEVIDFQNFIAQHGYDSTYHPLIGIVTEEKQDVLDVTELLARIQLNVPHKDLVHLMTNEVLTKVLAYRQLRIGEKIPIPVAFPNGNIMLILYEVETRIELAPNVPAFGLVPHSQEVPPILLFRGTDFSLRGIASILADLDLSGPGLTMFHSAQEEIHNWLYRVSVSHAKARIMGYSLGGSFTQYTCFYEHELVCKDPRFPSIAFNQPGMSEDLAYRWHQLEISKRPPLQGFVTEGDLVSTVGKLVGNVYELSLDYLLEPLMAHVTLMSLQQRVYTYQIDVTLKYEKDYSVHKKL